MWKEFDEKARANLDAVARLLPDDDGREGLGDAVANRAYYAAYQAVAHVAQRAGFAFTSDRDYYRHDTLPDDAHRRQILGDEGRMDLKELYGMRIKADYDEDPVEVEDADRMAKLATKLVKGLLG
jgi:hypothetical protein